MTRELADHSFNSKETEEHIIEIESTDVYYFGFLAHSIPNQYLIYLGDITIELVNGDAEGEDSCLVSDLPYELEVTNDDLYNLPECTSTENLGEGNQWAVSSYFGDNDQMNSYTLAYIYDSFAEPADTWFYTHPIQLEAGVYYELSYKYEGSADWPEKMKVAIGSDDTHEAMTQILVDHNNIDSFSENQEIFQVTEDGVYYIGFHAYSDANMNYLYLDDIRLDVATGCLPISDLSANQENEDSILLNWTSAEGTSSWEVKYDTPGFDPQTTGTSIEVENTPEVSINDLEIGEAYDFYVRTICDEDSSPWTGPLSFELEDLDICEAPTNIEIVEEDYGEFETGDIYIDLAWTASNEETAWEVQYGETGFNQDTEGTLVEVVENPEVKLEGLQGEKAYDIYVRALCGEEKHSEWTKITHTTLPLANVSDHLFKNFTYYPNPVADILFIQSDTEIKGLRIYNLLGQKLMAFPKAGTEVKIDLSTLQSGQYIIKAEIEGHLKTYQLIKR